MSENISLLGDDEVTYTNQDILDIISFKKKEIDEMFEEQSKKLETIRSIDCIGVSFVHC